MLYESKAGAAKQNQEGHKQGDRFVKFIFHPFFEQLSTRGATANFVLLLNFESTKYYDCKVTVCQLISWAV